MSRATHSLLFLLAVGLVSPVWAEKNATLEPKISKIGSPVVSESFDKPLAAPMVGVQGQWVVSDGSLAGKELAADKHAAVFNIQKSNRNSVVRFSFKLDDNTEGMTLSMNHAKGHLFRVTVGPSAISINLDKNKRDPASKAVVLATAEGKFDQAKWHTLQVEIVADRVVVQTDNGLVVEASHPSIDVDKPNYRLVMKGDSLAIDDLLIWDVE